MFRKLLHWFGVHNWKYFNDSDEQVTMLGGKYRTCDICNVKSVQGRRIRMGVVSKFLCKLGMHEWDEICKRLQG